MNSWDRQIIIEKVISAADKHGASNPQQQKQLIFGCSNAPEREVFFGLFSFFMMTRYKKINLNASN
jgi:hypothetical protein